jgi:type II secretory pathway component PulF
MGDAGERREPAAGLYQMGGGHVRTAPRRAAVAEVREVESMGPRRFPDAPLAALLGRLSIAIAAGVDLRRAWASESRRVPRVCQPAMQAVEAGLRAGEPLDAALDRAAGAFPPIVVGMVRAGERTGRLAEVLRDTAAAIEQSIRTRRELWRSLAGPTLSIVVAVLAVAVIVLASGGGRGDGGPDLLGLGLAGPRGLVTFLLVVVAVVAAAAVVWGVVARDWQRGGPSRAVLGRLPVVGAAIRSREAAAWCRAASLAAHVGLGPGEMVTLASASAPGVGIERDRLEQRLRRGDDLAAALAALGPLPRDVLEAVAVGEATGTTAETLDRVADLLDDRSRRGFATAAALGGYLAWAGAACLTGLIAYRVVSAYAGIIREAIGPR